MPLIPGAIHLARGLAGRVGLDLLIPDRRRDNAGSFISLTFSRVATQAGWLMVMFSPSVEK